MLAEGLTNEIGRITFLPQLVGEELFVKIPSQADRFMLEKIVKVNAIIPLLSSDLDNTSLRIEANKKINMSIKFFLQTSQTPVPNLLINLSIHDGVIIIKNYTSITNEQGIVIFGLELPVGTYQLHIETNDPRYIRYNQIYELQTVASQTIDVLGLFMVLSVSGLGLGALEWKRRKSP